MELTEMYEKILKEKGKFKNTLILDIKGGVHLLLDIILESDEIFLKHRNEKNEVFHTPAFARFIFLKQRLSNIEYKAMESQFKIAADYYLEQKRNLIGEKILWKGKEYFIMDVSEEDAYSFVIEDENFSVVNLQFDDVKLLTDKTF